LAVGAAPFDAPTAVAYATADIESRLIAMIGRCMVLELHVRRLDGSLVGLTPEERFEDFCRQVSQPSEGLSFLRRYPVLARRVVRALECWVSATVELLRRLRDDVAVIADFNPGMPLGLLVGFTAGQGDYHRGGRSVAILTFSSGLRIVYKPRSLAADLHFQHLLRWVAARQPGFDPRMIRVVDRATYGWVEFVEAAPCERPEQMQRFYRRQGSLLALAYVLEAADLHHENLLAAGDQPVLIDLEALFHRPADAQAFAAVNHAADHASVLDTGLLPAFVGSVSRGVDMSGVGATPGQRLPGLAQHWQYAGTDQARLVRRPITLGESRHRPAYAGRPGDPREHAGEIAAGFTDTYRVLVEHRAQLLGPNGPVAAFADDPVRVILRPTRSYERLLDESHHPDLMTDAVALEGHTNRLWDKIDQLPYLADVVIDERDDLEHGDIPVFTTRPASRDLWTSAGRTVTGFFTDSGLDRARRRIESLGEDDLAAQVWLMRTSLAPRLRLTAESAAHWEKLDRDVLVRNACVVGDRVLSLASHSPHPRWHGVQVDTDGTWRPGPVDTALYDGSAGIALFLAMLGKVAEEDRYTSAARAVVGGDLVHAAGEVTGPIGGYTGVGGTVYVLTALARLWRDELLLHAAETTARHIGRLVDNDGELDVMAGAAGAILALLPLARLRPSGPALAVAERCGEHLLRCARVMSEGCGWAAARDGHPPLGGLSHGAGGIALALSGLAAATGQERFAVAAAAGLAYERTTFHPAIGNWLDLRNGTPSPQFGSLPRTMTAWCHGATGVGLSRLGILRHRTDPALRGELEIAVQTTAREGFGASHSLCHGDMGALELLLQQHLTYPAALSHESLMGRAAQVIEDVDRTGLHCGNPYSIESPGLMTGIAGVGYELLRLADPGVVPAVLTLADIERVSVSRQ
jgi:type 2 lantibiotic biosynthesis protein LanM